LLRAKFRLCASKVLQPEAITPIVQMIETIETLDDMRSLSARIMQANFD
jgi:hypothetical protein